MDRLANRQCEVTFNQGNDLQGYSQENLSLQVLFQRLAEVSLPTSQLETFKRKQVIFYPDRSADRVYFLLEGAVKLSGLLDSGEEIAVALLPKNSIFGGFPFLKDMNSQLPCQAIALTLSTVFSASIEQIEQTLTDNADLTAALLQGLAHRTIESHQLIEILTRMRTGQRLERFLLLLCKYFGVSRGEGVLIDLPLSHYEIAQFIGVTRVTTTRELGRLRNSGEISISNGRILVRNIEQLRVRHELSRGY